MQNFFQAQHTGKVGSREWHQRADIKKAVRRGYPDGGLKTGSFRAKSDNFI